MKNLLIILALCTFGIASAQTDTTAHKKANMHNMHKPHKAQTMHKSADMDKDDMSPADDKKSGKTVRVDDPRGDNLPKTTTDQMK